MSESTNSVPTSQAQVPTPEQTPNPAAGGESNPEPGREVQAAQAAAEQQAAQAEEQARTEAEQSAKATVREFRKGERAMRAGFLEAGRWADVHLHQRMVLGDKRAAAVQTLEGMLALYASSPDRKSVV